MKKILILTAFALGSLAAAQTAPTPVETPAPADTAPVETPAPVDTTTTDTTTTTTTTDAAAPAMAAAMTPEESFTKAQEYATQADVAYPIPFYDRTLWKASVDSAYMAAAGDASNRDYTAYLGQLYTKTQWWINAYNVWTKIGDLTDAEKDWAALSAAKLAYIALNRGDLATAKTYVTQGMMWKSTPSLVAIQSRL
ncbi:hypothetical protein [Deinococcus altitudinis]|uniref:hypothetical protein n=1 Tax=Deinococcus altitudinis TaxID=468914 RepID=UPI003892BCDF